MEPVDMSSHLEAVSRHAGNAVLGGRSALRTPSERPGTCLQDQVTGMLGEAAACVYLLGSIEPWILRRRLLDRTPMEGDDGHDVPCILPIDVKSSKMRYSPSPSDYMLPVRPSEMKPDWCYVSAMVEMHRPVVHLSGWAISEMFPPPMDSGIFQGAHVIANRDLISMSALQWAIRHGGAM